MVLLYVSVLIEIGEYSSKSKSFNSWYFMEMAEGQMSVIFTNDDTYAPVKLDFNYKRFHTIKETK